MRLPMPHLSFVWMESMFETYLGYTINSKIQGEIRSPFVFICIRRQRVRGETKTGMNQSKGHRDRKEQD